MPVSEICVRDVIVAPKETPVQEAAHLMRQNHVGNLVVVDQRNGSHVPVGIVTDRDITVSVVATKLDPWVFTVAPEVAVMVSGNAMAHLYVELRNRSRSAGLAPKWAALADQLLPAGYPRIDYITADIVKPNARSTVARYDHNNDPALWYKRIHGSADPGRPTNVHLRVEGWPDQQFALLFVDWLKANPDVRDEYLSVKRDAERAASPDGDIERYLAVKEPWFLEAYRWAWGWADASGWRP